MFKKYGFSLIMLALILGILGGIYFAKTVNGLEQAKGYCQSLLIEDQDVNGMKYFVDSNTDTEFVSCGIGSDAAPAGSWTVATRVGGGDWAKVGSAQDCLSASLAKQYNVPAAIAESCSK